MRPYRILAILATVASTAPALAAEAVPLPSFRSIELRGGGEVILRHGPIQRVTLISGSTQHTSFEVASPDQRRAGNRRIQNSGEQLVITACDNSCPRDYRLRIEIVSPDIDALAIKGGGAIRTAGAFPRRDHVALAVSGGGTLDARVVRAGSVAAAVTGGGSISTQPLASLMAAVRGGGLIRYWGNPSVTQAVSGGGAVTRGGN